MYQSSCTQILKVKFVIFLLCFFQTVEAQKANTWYFGGNAGLNFNNTPPTALTNGLTNNSDNTSSISDNAGNLLFYTDGLTVWAKTHTVMSNGTGLVGSTTGGQCALIVPIPCDTNRYVIFHTTDFANPGWLHYTVVDMSLNSGFGGVVTSQKNVSLGSGWTEKLCAYYNAAGGNYWVLTHKWGNDQFVAFNVNSTSIATQSVVTSIGSTYTCGVPSAAHDAMGQLTISPDGTKVISALTCQDKNELFYMNQATGVLSNSISLPGNGGYAWGTAFSPNNNMIFTNSILGQSVYQYDIGVYTSAAIIASKYTLVTMPSTGYNFGYMELGPDNKLYIAKPGSTSLTVVNNPNVLGAASGFTLAGQSLGTRVSTHGLSRIAYNIQSGPPATISIAASPTLICQGQSSTLTATGGNTYLWSTNATGSVVVVTPSVSSIYTVTGNVSGCVGDRTVGITVLPSPTLTANANNSVICAGESATIISTGASTYTWSTNSSGSVIAVTPSVTSIYTVSGTQNSCTAGTTVNINVVPLPTVTVNASNTLICSGKTVTISALGASTYSWNNSLTSSVIVVSPTVTTTYSVVGTSNSCKNNAAVTISVNPTPTLIANASNTLICYGDVITLNAGGATSYSWNTGNTSATFTASPTVATNYTVVGVSFFCSDTASVSISIKPYPSLSFNHYSITCGSLGSATANVTGGTGPFSYSWNPTGQTSTLATGMFPGNYTLTVMDQGTGCILTPTIYFAPLIPLTGTVSASNSLTCNGALNGTANIALSGGSGSESYFWTDAIATHTPISATNLAAGINTIQVIDALTFCSVTHTFLITQPPAFTLNIGASSPSVCLGGSITFTANNSGGTPITPGPGYTYTWSNQPANNTLSVTEPLASTYLYTVTSTDANSCSVTNTIAVGFVANPTITVNSGSICALQQIALAASGASTYTWSSGQNSNPNVVSPLATTFYTVTGSALSCTTAATATVFLLPPPVPILNSNSPVCEGDTLKMTGTGGNTYLWTGPLNSFYNTQSVQIPAATPARNGNYLLKVTAANGCTAAVSQSLTVHPTPLLVASGTTVCEGTPLPFYSNYLSGASYSWTGPAFSSTLQSPVLQNASTLMTGNYTVVLTSAAGCRNMATVGASVATKPVPAISGDILVCYGKSISLQGSGGNSYKWYGPISFYAVSQNIVISNAKLANSGVYTLVVNAGPCNVSEQHTVSVVALPILQALSNSPVCENQTIQLNASGLASYTWSGPGNYQSTQQNTSINPASLSSSGIYTVIGTDSNGCDGSDTVKVVIQEAPLPLVMNGTVCLGGVLTLSASGGKNYNWSGPQNFTANTAVIVIPVVNASNTGVYTVVATGSNSCSTSSTVQVTGLNYQLPLPSISGPVKICDKGSIKLSGSGGELYFWEGPKNFLSTGKDINIMPADSSMGGVYTLTVKNNSNCVVSSTVAVSIYPIPLGILKSSGNKLCVPFCSDFNVTADTTSAAITSVTYRIGKEFFKNQKFNFCFKEPGDFLIDATFKDSNGCSNTATLMIQALEKPSADFYVSPSKPIAGIDPIKFYNTSTGHSITNWNWYFNGTDTVLNSDKNSSYIFENAGIYPVVLEVINDLGCRDTMIRVIVIEDEFSLYVPNAFTPDGDQLNDIFMPKGSGIKSYALEIYDRWGEKIFHTEDFFTGWDGTFKGSTCKSDSYVWRIKVTEVGGKARVLTGNVVLLR